MNSWRVSSHTLQLFKNSNDAQGKLRLNLHSLSVSVSELLEYRRNTSTFFVVAVPETGPTGPVATALGFQTQRKILNLNK
jgi:hypothetical protein